MSKTQMVYFKNEDILHLSISEEPESVSVELSPNITAELNDKGELIGIEIINGEAKFWMEPKIELAKNYGLNDKELRTVKTLIEEHADEIRNAWHRHFGN
ncbi:MAG: DUF2283 domain-containing protein [Burkholderiales bacterium]